MPAGDERDATGSPWSDTPLVEQAGLPFDPPGPNLGMGRGGADHDGVGTTPEGGEVVSSGGMFLQIVRVFRERKLAVAGLAVIVLMILFCWLGPVFYHTNQTNAQQALVSSTASNSPPNAQNPLGTDNAGFDVLGRLMFGGRTHSWSGWPPPCWGRLSGRSTGPSPASSGGGSTPS